MKRENVSPRQKDSSWLTTERVQLWSKEGIMLTAQLTNKEAAEKVKKGDCFVCTEQAIAYYNE